MLAAALHCRSMKAKLPTIQEIIDYVASQDAQFGDDLESVVRNILTVVFQGILWRRRTQNIGPVLHKLRNGKQLSRAEARSLLNFITWSTYFMARNANMGFLASQRAWEPLERLSNHFSQQANQHQGG